MRRSEAVKSVPVPVANDSSCHTGIFFDERRRDELRDDVEDGQGLLLRTYRGSAVGSFERHGAAEEPKRPVSNNIAWISWRFHILLAMMAMSMIVAMGVICSVDVVASDERMVVRTSAENTTVPLLSHTNITTAGQQYENTRRHTEAPGRVYIDVTSFAEGISAWRVSIIELLELARAINGTLVEPCMKNGRLSSCSDQLVPVSGIFDLSRYMHHLVPYAKYRERRSLRATNSTEYRGIVCGKGKSKCSAAEKINREKMRRKIQDQGRKQDVVLQVESYWKYASIVRLAKILGIKNPCPKRKSARTRLSFHADHFRTVDEVLRNSNVSDGNFSVIHFRAERKGMDFIECSRAVLDAKHAMLKNMTVDETMGESNHTFVLMTSLNDDPNMMWSGSRKVALGRQNNTGKHALDFLKSSGFVKIDDLMKKDDTIQDPGMLAIYDLILAMKSKNFATCARGGGLGCNQRTRSLCDRCNHVGKFGTLALSMRPEYHGGSSYGCWPQTSTGK